MADKRRSEQNHRWLTNLRRDIAGLQEFAIGCSVLCTKDSPEVEWDELQKRIKAISATVAYAKANDRERTTTGN